MSCANLPGPPGRNVSTAFDVWARSDEYHNSFLLKRDPALDAALSASDAAGLPQIAVSAAQGKFLMLLARTIRAKRILEVGTLGGYSTIWLARALPPEGRLITCELKQEHADVARKNLAYAGFEEPRIQILVGPAVDTLRSLDTAEPFDLVFIDADKKGNLEYMREAKRLTRSEGAIVRHAVVLWGPTCSLTSHRSSTTLCVKDEFQIRQSQVTPIVKESEPSSSF
jgi:predicted O-methyltransferase YrrM